MPEKLPEIVRNQPEDKPYLVTGRRIYVIGAQDGGFPQRGEHMPHEMWGIWLPPIKLFNGFWLWLEDDWIGKADRFVMEPFGCRFVYERKEIELERFQWAAHTRGAMALELTVRNLTQAPVKKSLALVIESNLMPVWLSERMGRKDGKDSVSCDLEKGLAAWKDAENPWSAAMICDQPLDAFELLEESRAGSGQRPCGSAGKACDRQGYKNENTSCCKVSFSARLAAGESKRFSFFFGGSVCSQQEAGEQAGALMENRQELLEEKRERYLELGGRASLSFAGEPVLEQMYRWNQFINDWIQCEIPGVGEGVVAGYAEFPWWFGNDTNYILPALLMQGEVAICKETLRLLRRASLKVNGNGRVIHEMSNNGVVFYEGMTTETPQFADCVWQIYCFEGDESFLEEMYDFCREGMRWIESVSEEGLPRGYGISEVAGLDCMCCDVAILAVRGYEVMSKMAEALGREADASCFEEKFCATWEIFHREFFIPETGFYGDMVAGREEIIKRAESWKHSLKSFPITPEDEIAGEASCKQDKSPRESKEKERLCRRMENVIRLAKETEPKSRRAYQLFGLGHSTIAVEFGYVTGKQARELLAAQEQWREKECFQIDGIMPLALGRRMQAYGYSREPEKILQVLRQTGEGFGAVMPGATSEIYPDRGCFVQGWNSFATMWPYFSVIFGVRPRAGQKELILQPCICPDMGKISLTGVMIAGRPFSFFLDFEEGRGRIRVEIPSAQWRVNLVWEEEQDGKPELVVEVCDAKA